MTTVGKIHRNNIHPIYRPDIDGLRAVAVLSVVIFHAFPSVLPGGFIGVDIFFVISGYLISRIIMESLEGGCFSFASFYARRVKRIFPALLLVMVATLAFGWIALFANEYRQLGKHTLAGATFVSNLVLWSESGYFDNAAITKPLLHLWSLGVEEQFYIFWPLFLWLAWRLRFNLLFIAVGIAAMSFGANILQTIHNPPAAFYSPHSRFWELMMGAMLAYGAIHHKFRRVSATGDIDEATPPRSAAMFKVPSPYFSAVASLLGMGLIILGILNIREQNFPGWQALIPTVGASLLILAGPLSPFNRFILSARPMVWLGLISYPLYLWHWPLISFVRILHGEPGVAMQTMLVLLSIVLARLTYTLVELPLKDLAKRLPTTVSLSTLMVVVSFAGFLIMTQDGIESRAVVQENSNLESGKDGGYPPTATGCPFLTSEQEKLFQCHVDTRASPRFALLGDSKAGALFMGLFRTSAPTGTWIFYGSGKSGPLLPVLSDNPIYNYVNRTAIETAVQLIGSNKTVETVVIAAAARALFHLDNDYSIADLPDSKNYEAALNGLDNVVSRLLDAHKGVVLVVDNPTFPYMQDCLARTTNSAFFNELLTAPLNPACKIAIPQHLKLSKQYRDMLFSIQRRHPHQVSVFDTIPILCDEKNGVCAPTMNGRFLYSVTDHISEYAARLVGQKLNAELDPEGFLSTVKTVTITNWGPPETIAGQDVNIQPDGTSAMWISGENWRPMGPAFVYFGNDGLRSPATIGKSEVTLKIPPDVIRRAGNYSVTVVEGSGRRTEVGTFVVRPGQSAVAPEIRTGQ